MSLRQCLNILAQKIENQYIIGGLKDREIADVANEVLSNVGVDELLCFQRLAPLVIDVFTIPLNLSCIGTFLMTQ